MSNATTIEEAIRRHLLRYHAEGCDLESSDVPYRLATSLGLDPNMTVRQFANARYPKVSDES